MATFSTPILSPVDQERVIQDFNKESKVLMRLLERHASNVVIDRMDSLIKEINQITSPRCCFFSEENNAQLTSYASSLITAKKLYASFTENNRPQEAMCA